MGKEGRGIEKERERERERKREREREREVIINFVCYLRD